MQRMTGQLVSIIAAVCVSAGCATKSFVTEQVDARVSQVEERVAGVEQSLSETAAETRTNRARITEVDQTATSALDSATTANASATDAQEGATVALARTDALEAANRQLLFEVVVAEEHDRFTFGDAGLPDTSTTKLDTLVERLRDYDTAVHLEIEGHTDSTGPAVVNERLGLKRAESVRRYLHEQHQLPLHKINLISYGEDKPVAENDTPAGRAKNRRVVVRVLGSAQQVTHDTTTVDTQTVRADAR